MDAGVGSSDGYYRESCPGNGTGTLTDAQKDLITGRTGCNTPPLWLAKVGYVLKF